MAADGQEDKALFDELDSIDALLEEAEQSLAESSEPAASDTVAAAEGALDETLSHDAQTTADAVEAESAVDPLSEVPEASPEPAPSPSMEVDTAPATEPAGGGDASAPEPAPAAMAEASQPPREMTAAAPAPADDEAESSATLPDIDEVLQPTPQTVDELLPETPPEVPSAPEGTPSGTTTGQAAAISPHSSSTNAMPGLRGGGQETLSARDMEAIKKHILIFGITLVVMGVIGWGLTIWAAIAASSVHLDEETITLLEDIKVGMEHMATGAGQQKKALSAVEKKMDALNYQLEQINADLGKLEMLLAQSGPASKMAEDHHEGGAAAPRAQGHARPAAVHGAPAGDPDVKKTLASINSRVVRTQKKVEQVYARLGKVQSQYRALLAQLKAVRQALLAQKKQKSASASAGQPESVRAPVDRSRDTRASERYEYRYPPEEAGAYDPVYINSYP